MTCLCSLQLGNFLNTLPTFPNVSVMVPLIPLDLVVAIQATLPGMALSMSASADLALSANLSAMASLTAAVQAALGVNLAANLSATAMASVQASMAATIGSLNANAMVLNLAIPNLASLLGQLMNLHIAISLVSAVRLGLGIDLRLPGAIAALQAHLNASARLNVAARVSVVQSLMANMGFAFNARGALMVSARAQAMAALTLGLPALRVNIQALNLLAALLALLAALIPAINVNLRAPNAMAQLRLALAGLPLTALASLRVNAAASASVAATAAVGLNLAAVANANLSAAAALAMAMSVVAQGSFLLAVPGTCGLPCPVGLVAAL
jgi:hypothetical protein